MTTLPQTPTALTIERCRDLLAAGRTHLRVRAGHPEAGRQVIMYRIEGDVVWGTYETYRVQRGNAIGERKPGYWPAADLEIDG